MRIHGVHIPHGGEGVQGGGGKGVQRGDGSRMLVV